MIRRKATPLIGLVIAVAAVVLLQSSPASADDAARPNCVSVRVGGQVRLSQYKTGLALGGGYARWLSGISWLDLNATVLVHKQTNLRFDGGLRWKFARTKGGVRGFLRAGLELAVLMEGKTRAVVAGRVGGGAGYYSSANFGATIEAGVSLGPAFGDGVHVASALDIMVGAEFPF